MFNITTLGLGLGYASPRLLAWGMGINSAMAQTITCTGLDSAWVAGTPVCALPAQVVAVNGGGIAWAPTKAKAKLFLKPQTLEVAGAVADNMFGVPALMLTPLPAQTIQAQGVDTAALTGVPDVLANISDEEAIMFMLLAA